MGKELPPGEKLVARLERSLTPAGSSTEHRGVTLA